MVVREAEPLPELPDAAGAGRRQAGARAAKAAGEKTRRRSSHPRRQPQLALVIRQPPRRVCRETEKVVVYAQRGNDSHIAREHRRSSLPSLDSPPSEILGDAGVRVAHDCSLVSLWEAHVRLEKFRRGSVFAVAQDPKQRLRAETTASVQRAHAPAASRGCCPPLAPTVSPAAASFASASTATRPSPRRIERRTTSFAPPLSSPRCFRRWNPVSARQRSSRISSKSSSNAAWSVSATRAEYRGMTASIPARRRVEAPTPRSRVDSRVSRVDPPSQSAASIERPPRARGHLLTPTLQTIDEKPSPSTQSCREMVRDFFAQLRVVCLAPSATVKHVDASGGVSDAPDDARIAAYRAGTSRSSSSNSRRKKCSEASFSRDSATEATRGDAADVGVRSPSLPPSLAAVPLGPSRSGPAPHGAVSSASPAIPTRLGVSSSCAARSPPPRPSCTS